MSKLLGRTIIRVRHVVDNEGNIVPGIKRVDLDGGAVTIKDELLDHMKTGKVFRVGGLKR